MKKHFRDLLKYNEWANYRVLKSIEEVGSDQQELLKLYSHILSAQTIWLNRIKDLPTSPFPVWQEYKLSELKTMTEESSDYWNDYMGHHKLETFEEMIFYTDTEGKKHENTIREIITHMVNHSTYHRGQVARAMRTKGLEPPVTDYIAYARTK